MKGFNIFLAVLIFLLAAVSALFSFFLFEKRAQLVDGWHDMADKINTTAANLDKGSGTEVAGKLTTDTLDHKKYADLPGLLPELPAQAEKVIAERDALAKGLSSVSRTLEKSDLPESKFQNMASYQNALQQLGAYVSAYQQRNNSILSKISASASKLGAKVSVSQLKSSGYGDAYNALDQRISYYLARVAAFDRSMRNIASSAEVASPNLSESGYSTGINSVATGVQTLRRDRDDTRVKLKNAERKIETLNQTVAEKNSQINDLNALNAKKDAEIKSLRKAMGMKVEDPIPLNDGCAESFRMLRNQSKGRIMDIDDKFGFFVVSVGSQTTVQEKVGDYINNVNPQIPNGTEMVIARSIPGKDPEYIGKLKLTKVADTYSIAELVDNASGKRPKVGDAVFFSDEEIEKIMKSRK